MTEENETRQDPVYLGKFKSVDALARAYEELEAEFTRRSQRLKALEEQAEAPSGGTVNAEPPRAAEDSDELYRAVTENEEVKTRILSDYLGTLKGVPLLGGGGAGVTAPRQRPKTIAEAGALALGFIRRNSEQGGS